MQAKKYLKWCLQQKKGIKITKESSNLQKAYLGKSKKSLKSMEANIREGIDEWTISTSYYAKYFAIYALLSRIGIKCEIHDCTITLFSFLFGGEVSSDMLKDLRQSKGDRIDAQYYTGIIQIDDKELLKKTKDFVLKIEEIIDDLNTEKIQDARKKVKSIV